MIMGCFFFGQKERQWRWWKVCLTHVIIEFGLLSSLLVASASDSLSLRLFVFTVWPVCLFSLPAAAFTLCMSLSMYSSSSKPSLYIFYCIHSLATPGVTPCNCCKAQSKNGWKEHQKRAAANILYSLCSCSWITFWFFFSLCESYSTFFSLVFACMWQMLILLPSPVWLYLFSCICQTWESFVSRTGGNTERTKWCIGW